MIFIDEIVATEVMDSRGNPTVKVTVSLSDGTVENLQSCLHALHH